MNTQELTLEGIHLQLEIQQTIYSHPLKYLVLNQLRGMNSLLCLEIKFLQVNRLLLNFIRNGTRQKQLLI